MERQHKNVKLPFKYWSKPEYEKKYIKNLQLINKYCKIYDEKAILNVLTEKSWIYSFFYPKFWELVEKEEERLESFEYKEIKKTETAEVINKKQRKISRLKKLDD